MKKCRTLLPVTPAFFAVAVFASLALLTALSLKAQRLPDSVVPEHYALTLTPDLNAATFSGVETIDVAIKAPTNTVTLNAAEIAFQSVNVSAAGKQQTAGIALDAEKQQAIFFFPSALPVGKASLQIHFTGLLNNELRGFYLSKTGRRNYAVTQFEPTDARRAFPCFDEPALKASYDISLVVDRGDTAISNNPIANDKPGPVEGKHTITFSTTPRMSTYLVAFLVGDFECTSGEQDGVAIRSCAAPEKKAFTPYGLEVGKFSLHYFNTYFGIPYPLKKLDLIAVPDFEAGAMENFGAITFRESDFLLDPKSASIDSEKQVGLVIAHEIAHQWFGDLVTMQWWDNIWLNEGFATWMENKAIATMHPEWNLGQDVAADMDRALNIDANPTTRAIRAKADTPDEINQMFDGIAYDKAGNVLLSIENFIGEDAFRRGVHNYLTSHLYGNATAEDFWNAEAAASHKPVDRIMDSLITEPGVPLLTFGEPNAGKVSVSQHRFYLSPSIQPDPSQKWTLPVCFKAGPDSKQCDVLTPQTAYLKVPSTPLFFANAGGKGYYRSLYSPEIYKALVAQVESGLTPEERINLIGDEWARLRANKASAGDYLDLVAAVKDDPNAQVLSSALDGVYVIYHGLAATPEEKDALAQWICRNFSPVYKRLGPPSASDSPDTLELRAQLFAVLGFYGNDPTVIAEAHKIAEQYLADPDSVEPTLRQTALAVAARNGDEALFDHFQKIYETSANPEFQIGALQRLAQFEDPSLLERALDFAVSGKVRNQDAAFQLAIALGIDKNRDQAWQFIQSHWSEVQAQFTTDMGARLVSSTGSFCSASSRDSVEQFFTSHKVAASDSALRHAIEVINGCIEFRTMQEPQLKSWLSAQPKS
jgi:aminopeptidase N